MKTHEGGAPMSDPHELYSVEEDLAAELQARVGDGSGPVLVHLVRGFIDAGGAAELLGEHLVERFETRRLATFDIDQLLDYRARRPMMTFDVSRWRDYDEPQLVVDLVQDAEGTRFLLMHGLEPDVQWERFAAAVRQIVERFSVSLTVGVNGIPMGVPHTRPLGVTTHGTRSELVGTPGWFGTVQVPASVGSLLEYRLGRWGHDAVGVAVHVPHYLAQAGYPPAAMVALEHVEQVTGLALDASALEPAASEAIAAVERQVTGSEDVATVVRALEEQYDTFSRTLGRTSLLADSTDLPTADEIGAEFERFLAQQQGPDAEK
jgi:hypothetical protein